MGLPHKSAPEVLSPFEQLRLGREVVRTEGRTLVALADRLGEEFCQAVSLLSATRGSVIVSGMGKAGLIGQKLAATFASTGTRSHYLHPGEAIHGDDSNRAIGIESKPAPVSSSNIRWYDESSAKVRWSEDPFVAK